MRQLLLTRARQFYPFAGFMRAHGIAVEPYLARHRLPGDLLETPDRWIEQPRFWPLLEDLVRREALPGLGAVIGEQLDVGELGDLGEALLGQATLYKALKLLCTQVRKESLTFDFSLRRAGSSIWFVSRCRGGTGAYSHYVDHYDIELMKRLVESALGVPWVPEAIRLRDAALPPGMDPALLTPERIHFGAGETGVAIPVELLSRPMSGYVGSAERPPELAANGSAVPESDLRTQLRWLLESKLDQDPDLRDLAAAFCTSERTLQRHLAGNGTTFREMLEEARFDRARRLLAGTGLRLTDIGLELGFSSPASFSRAFQRWAGVSPREYRKRARLQ